MEKNIITACLMSVMCAAPAFAQTTGAVSTVSGDELYQTATQNFTNTLVGKLSGLTVLEGTGELGNDNAKWLIRGMGSYGIGSWNTAKIFVDGFEVNSEYLVALSPSEIESVSVLKDAAALALYGERGANGVISITTRRGQTGEAKVHARTRFGVQTPSSINRALGSYDYANLYNQAVSNDAGMVWTPAYSEAQLNSYKGGEGVNVDWYDQALKSAGNFVDGDVILNGGNLNARYNINLGYLTNSGVLNTKNTDQTRNLNYDKFNLRANLDFNVLRIFEVKMDMGGRIENFSRPNYSVSQLFSDLAKYPSNIYNVFDDDAHENYSGTAIYPNNPYASVNGLGWYSSKKRSLQTNIAVKERLDMVLEGLYLQEAVSFYSHTISTYSKTKNYARYYNGETTTTDETTTITASGYGSGGMQDWKQGKITAGYDHTFGRHAISSALNFNVSAYKGDGYFSYMYNTVNLNGFVNYSLADKLVAELAFSYFGNDAYAKGKRWAFYPAASVAYIPSERLKLRASAGLSGASDSAATGVLSEFSSNGRYLFKDYFTYSYVGSFYMGQSNPAWQNTYVPMFISNPDAHAEKSLKLNIGADLHPLSGLSLSLDAYMDRRTDILTLDNSLMAYYGKQYYFSNVGKMTSWGADLTASYCGKSGDFRYEIDGMLSYAGNRIDYMAEVAPANAFSAKTGRPYGTIIGLVAEGFYDIADFDDYGNLYSGQPVPAFGNVQPGDIKYRDLDGNGMIDQNDVTKIGKSEYPEWYFTLGARLGYRKFDFSFALQGVAGRSVNLLDNWNQTVAFVDNGNAFALAKGAWAYYPTEGIDNRANATYPRLTTQSNQNNYQTSSFWVKNGSFLKLRNIELGYNFSSECRVFVNAHNLFTLSSVLRDYNLDPENITGLYPMMRSFNAGVTLTF